MALTLYERDIQRELETWQQGDESLLRRLMDMAMTPVDWAAEQAVPAEALEQFDQAVEKFFASLSEASNWTVSQSRILSDARRFGIEADELASLRKADMEKLDALARCGARDDGGVCRLALTDADREGRDLVVAWMKEQGLDVAIDAIGNIHGTRAGLEGGPVVMTGSHIDTVATGGRYDGNYGVLAGLEVMRTLDDRINLAHTALNFLHTL